MVFALDKDDGSLLAFTSQAEAAAHCKPIDVQDGFWLFFAQDGKPLEARFMQEGDSTQSPTVVGPYVLQQAMSGRWLQERLSEVRTVEGCGLTTVAQLVETWNTGSGSRAARKP